MLRSDVETKVVLFFSLPPLIERKRRGAASADSGPGITLAPRQGPPLSQPRPPAPVVG